jgi:DNA polymerase III alpha subunit
MNLSAGIDTVHDDAVVIGLGGVKFLGEKNLVKVLKSREDGPFRDFEDFVVRTGLNKRAVEFMGYAGCFGSDKTAGLQFEREALGYNIDRRLIDDVWYGKYVKGLGEIMDIHKITTKKGLPMAFLTCEYDEGSGSITVFPDAWSALKDYLIIGAIGIFRVDDRGVLESFAKPDDVSRFRVEIPDDRVDQFLSFCPSLTGEANIYCENMSVASVNMTEEMLRFVESEFGIMRIF